MAEFLEGLADWLAALPADEAAVARHAFGALLEGRAVRPAELRVPGHGSGAVASAVARLGERGMLALDRESGAIAHVRGLSLRQTAHALAVGGRGLYASCAVDAVGIPAALGLHATVGSRCHACHTPVALELAAGAITRAPDGVRVWAPDFDPGRPLDVHT